MSIVTKTGDDGTTGLLFNRRVSKAHARIEACGAVDELNAALGLARALCRGKAAQPAGKQIDVRLLKIQPLLIGLMGEIAVLPRDRQRYRAQGRRFIGPDDVMELERWAAEMERGQPPARGWLLPGICAASAALHVARTVCRRAERHVVALNTGAKRPHADLIRFLNRLSDVLWLMARQVECCSKRVK